MTGNPFKRAVEVPAEVASRASLGRGEKVLAGTRAKDGSWLLGTGDALLILGPGAAPVRLPWEQVERADWEREEEVFRLSEVGEFGRVRAEYTFELDEPGRLLQLVRERVTASLVLQRRVVVSGRSGLFVIARRPPNGTGEITWAYEFDRGVDPEDPLVMEAAQRGLRAAADELGL